MIQGMQGLSFSSKPKELRAFLRDELKLPCTDTGGGRLVFDFEASDLGVHPIADRGSQSGAHDI